MFDDVRIPIRLQKDTINEAILDIRIEQQLDEKAIAKIVSDFLEAEMEVSSIQSLPTNVRESDIQLKYSPAYKIRKDGYFVGIGLHNLFFDCTEQYPGWESFSKWIYSVIEKIKFVDEYGKYCVKQIVIRYIDLFDGEINNCCDVHFKLRENDINNTYSFSTKLTEDDFSIVLNIGAYKVSKSVVDVGVYKDVQKISLSNFLDSQAGNVDKCHMLSKKYFFGLLKDDFLETLEPIYKEDK